ncbi:unknown [Clostridium sp. CAG:169]|nr:unknown [Clostridium sp. CAG:169]
MAKQGRYYQMWQAQAKYYQEEQEMQERFGQQVFA